MGDRRESGRDYKRERGGRDLYKEDIGRRDRECPVEVDGQSRSRRDNRRDDDLRSKKRSKRDGETEDERRERRRLKKERKEMRRERPQAGAGSRVDHPTIAGGRRGGPNLTSEDDQEELDAGPVRPVQPRRAYDDEDNASVPFVWKKKDTMLRRQGVRVTHEDEAARRVAAAEELERAKARREERQKERDEIEAARAKAARDREQEMNADWDRMEESFHGQQHFMRQAIRLRENRPTVADSLARNVRLDLLELTADPRSPCELLNGMKSSLTHDALSGVAEAIQLELDYIPDFSQDDDTEIFTRSLRLEWWQSLDVFVKDLLAWCAWDGSEVEPAETENRSSVENDGRSRRREAASVHPSVQNELEKMLSEKSRDELVEMEAGIASRLEAGSGGKGGGADLDFAEVDFWQAALGRIRRDIAEARISELNSVLAEERSVMMAAIPEEPSRDGGANQKPGHSDGMGEGHVDIGEEAMVCAEMAKGMKENEERFADIVNVAGGQGYAWNDKYRPRRPRFFNRVQTGYDWNKYNRTHYDHDNPPPKTVQGYKFNIFYPDLIDRSVAPTFAVARTDNPDVSILTFKAGPPYEDIAFKIVNRLWEHSHRRGFRCTFDRGVLQLWFNFRRLRYRR